MVNGRTENLDQLQSLQARMPVLADDDVIVHGDAERACDVGNLLGHLDVGVRLRRIAGGMIVQENAVRKITLMSFSFSMRSADRGRG